MGTRWYLAPSKPPARSGPIKAFFIEVLRPLILLIFFLLKVLWIVAFSWWVNPLLDRQMRNSFTSEIRQVMPFLFDRFGGRVIPDPSAAGNDYGLSYVSIASQDLIFKFSKWRSEDYRVRVSSVYSPTDFYDLVDALRAIDLAQNQQFSPYPESLLQYSRLLEPRYELLVESFREENFDKTRATLAEMRLLPR